LLALHFIQAMPWCALTSAISQSEKVWISSMFFSVPRYSSLVPVIILCASARKMMSNLQYRQVFPVIRKSTATVRSSLKDYKSRLLFPVHDKLEERETTILIWFFLFCVICGQYRFDLWLSAHTCEPEFYLPVFSW
jgi:hypothetical protein